MNSRGSAVIGNQTSPGPGSAADSTKSTVPSDSTKPWEVRALVGVEAVKGGLGTEAELEGAGVGRDGRAPKPTGGCSRHRPCRRSTMRPAALSVSQKSFQARPSNSRAARSAATASGSSGCPTSLDPASSDIFVPIPSVKKTRPLLGGAGWAFMPEPEIAFRHEELSLVMVPQQSRLSNHPGQWLDPVFTILPDDGKSRRTQGVG